jgi:1-phosphatidylinositol-3-phosphate 5-kinase
LCLLNSLFIRQPTEYLFPDSYVVVREDEPSTIIAYTLSSEDYIDKMHDIQGCSSDNHSHDGTIRPDNVSMIDAKAPSEVTTVDNNGAPINNPQAQPTDDIQETLLRESGTHMRYSMYINTSKKVVIFANSISLDFSTGSTKFFCKIFFSEQFDALRRNCGCDESYIMSLASCIKWDSSGGKSGSAFLKMKGILKNWKRILAPY